jgi:transposase
LEHVNLDAAGIDVGATSHFVAVPVDRDPAGRTVREFGAFTADLYALADWLTQCRITTIALESTGVYWIALLEVLEARGFEVKLVDPRRLKQVPGRKSDILDCQWLQQLHTYGLLAGAFRPDEQVCILRSYLRQRAMLVSYAAHHIQHMQKALTQMNIQLHHVVSDITGVTGMRIVRAIVAGERSPQVLARHRDPRCHNDEATIAKALEGSWRTDHLFELRQALELFDTYHTQITACDRQIEAHLASFDNRAGDQPVPALPRARRRYSNSLSFDPRSPLFRMTGVDLTRIDGIDVATALTVVSEIGLDMTRWHSAKHFASWLGLCPGTRISGGKVLSRRTKPCANRAATALRLAANGLYHSRSALGAFLRRKKAHLGAPKAITATAHKLARLVYSMLRYGTDYVDKGQDYYEMRYQDRVLRNLARNARLLGYQLTPMPPPALAPSPA